MSQTSTIVLAVIISVIAAIIATEYRIWRYAQEEAKGKETPVSPKI